MKIASLILGLCLLAGRTIAQELTPDGIAPPPEHWPKECTMKKSFDFQAAARA